MSEQHLIYHLLIIKICGTYSFENSIYPLAPSVARLIQKCIRSPMNILSAILRTNVILRHFINSNIDDKNDYSLSGLFLNQNDIIETERLISRNDIADCFYGTLRTVKKCEQVVIRVMHNYDNNVLNDICQELHISNLLRRFISVDSVVPVQSVKIFQSPYIIIYPFMNCGSFPDFVQRIRPQLTFNDRIEIAVVIARVLADMHFLGLLHCNIAARNIFVRKIMTTGSKLSSDCPTTLIGYKYYLGDFRQSYIGKIKKINPQKSINIRWLAPEIFKTKKLTQATDVYAFGITLYEIFTGNLPYFSMSSEEIGAKLITGQRIRPEIHDIELPPDVLKLMKRCWRTDRRERPTMDGIWLRLKAIKEIEICNGKCSECNLQEKENNLRI